MAEPQIRYARTDDDVSIAYYAMGQGPVLVVPSNILWSNVRHESVFREYQRSGKGIGANMTLVRYDGRGSGLSDRSELDHGIEARLRDLEAVVAKLSLKRFSLLGGNHATPTAIEFSARHPEAVEKLILYNPYAVGTDYQRRIRRLDSFRAIAGEDWEEYTLAVAAANVGYGNPALLEGLARRFRESMEPLAAQSFNASLAGIDVRPALSRVQAPTLVIFREGATAAMAITAEMAQEVAFGIPDCEFLRSEGEPGIFWTETETATIEAFLGVAAGGGGRTKGQPLAGTSLRAPTGMAVILFADIADSTATTERIGDTAFREKARALDDALRIAVRDNGGSVVDAKTLGDGILATFPAASQAIVAALACGVAGDAQGLPLHIGVHAGDVIRESDNVFGGAVNIASRISALAPPGEVFVSRTVADLARTSAGVTFEDRGEHAFKGIAEPQRVYAVRAAEVG